MATYLKKILIIVFIVTLNTNAIAGSVAGFGGSTEITQIANNIQLMLSYAEQVNQVSHMITQIANQINMYNNMITNTQDLITAPFKSATATIMNLKSTIDAATSLSYTLGSVDSYFTKVNPNYATLFTGTNYEDLQKDWRDTLFDYCEGALKAANMSITNINSDAALLTQLTTASNSAVGQKSAIQAANNIALEMTAKLGELKMLTAAQVQSQSIYLTQKQAKEDAETERKRQFYNYDSSGMNLTDDENISVLK